jgi:hypothetical protein
LGPQSLRPRWREADLPQRATLGRVMTETTPIKNLAD